MTCRIVKLVSREGSRTTPGDVIAVYLWVICSQSSVYSVGGARLTEEYYPDESSPELQEQIRRWSHEPSKVTRIDASRQLVFSDPTKTHYTEMDVWDFWKTTTEYRALADREAEKRGTW